MYVSREADELYDIVISAPFGRMTHFICNAILGKRLCKKFYPFSAFLRWQNEYLDVLFH